uniref:Uncharacterized protein n=1 Tax=Anguilla anguilla TaxID=7936 RepID=A0A0E9RKN0_ANGAN
MLPCLLSTFRVSANTTSYLRCVFETLSPHLLMETQAKTVA